MIDFMDDSNEARPDSTAKAEIGDGSFQIKIA